MFERIFKNPVSTLLGVGAFLASNLFQYAADMNTAFTWKGWLAGAPALLLGALLGDGKKEQ